MVVLCFQILYFTDPCCSPLQAIDDSPLDPVVVVGGEVNVPVCVSCLPVDYCCQPVSPSCDQPIQERKFPILLQPIIYLILGLIVFRCSRTSCNLSLTSFQEDSWYKSMDRGNMIGVVFLDISKAFNTIDHSIILRKLRKLLSLSDSSCQWVESYLQSREQAVRFAGMLSPTCPITADVPQACFYAWSNIVLHVHQ